MFTLISCKFFSGNKIDLCLSVQKTSMLAIREWWVTNLSVWLVGLVGCHIMSLSVLIQTLIAESSSGRRCRPSLSGSTRRGRSWASTPKPRTIASAETPRRNANSPHTGKLCTNVTRDAHARVHSRGWNEQGVLFVSPIEVGRLCNRVWWTDVTEPQPHFLSNVFSLYAVCWLWSLTDSFTLTLKIC